ncbi:MAG: hypothetical protein WCC12_18355 [Anaerolineales bacterium]
MTAEELIENIIQATNQSRGSVNAILDELDVQTENGLRSGRIVQYPNGMHFRPIGHKDGDIAVNVRVNPRILKNLNVNFRGRWKNAQNIGKTEAEIIALWNDAHPDNPVEVISQPEPEPEPTP